MYFICTDAARSGLDLLPVWLPEPYLCAALRLGDWEHSWGRQAQNQHRDQVPREILGLVSVIYCHDHHTSYNIKISKTSVWRVFLLSFDIICVCLSMLLALLQIIVILLRCQQALNIIGVGHVTPVNAFLKNLFKVLGNGHITWTTIRL